MLTITMQDRDDPHAHLASAQQRGATEWTVQYYRGDELVSEGSIYASGVPVASLVTTLEALRTEADYWAARG